MMMKRFNLSLVLVSTLLPGLTGMLVFPSVAGDAPQAARGQVITWVPPYNWQQCESMLSRDLGGVEMGDALTHVALQFWRPDPATGAVVYVDHEWQTPDDTVVARFQDWAEGRDVALLLCAYNNDGQWNWDLVGPILRDPAKRAAHVAALVAETLRLGLDGVDIDYEWPGGDNRDEADFLMFVEELSVALRAEGLQFFLSTFAHIWNFPNATHWNAIAPWVDGINSMGYEEIGRAGEGWRAYADQKGRIDDPAKLLLGMPAYVGGEWLGNTVEEHVDWVVENGDVGIAIWEATLSNNPAWLNPAVWRKLSGLKNPAPPAQGLRVYYDFEETGAAGLANKAPVPGGLFHASRFGGGAFDSSANPSGPGFAGKADFNPGNGASDRSQLVAGNALNLVDTRGDAIVVPVGNRDLGSSFTIASWHALTPSGGSVARPFVFESSDNYNVSWGIGSGDSYTAYVTQAAAFGGHVLERGVWHHVAHVFQISPDFKTITLRLYINGDLVGTRTGAPNSMRFSALHFGKHRGSGLDRAWDGMLDELAIWSRALTANEVRAIYQMGADGIPLSATFDPVDAYRGQVFTDDDGTRVPMAGVAVSDGLNVVRTGADGRFELPGVARTRFIQVTVPSGYRAAERHFIPVRDHAGDFDFELVPHGRSAGDSVRFLQLADTETDQDTGGWIASVRDYAANQDVGFIVHTGDIPYAHGMNFHHRELNQRTMGLPVYYCIGNHDLETGAYGEEMFETLFGPVFYSFEAGNTHFVVTPMLSGTHAPSYNVTQVYEWLVNDLANMDPDKNLVVFNHFNLTTGNDFNYGPGGAQSVRLNDHRLKAWIYGHHHANYKKRHGETGIISVQSAPPTMGGINHSTGNFLVYDMDAEGAIDIEQVYPRIDEHLVIATPVGRMLSRGPGGGLTVSANAYDGRSPVVAAEARVGGGPWQPMERHSDWNWSLEHDPVGLAEGETYPIDVRATLANGVTIERAETFVFTESPRPTAGLRLDWVRNTGGNSLFGAPVVADGRVFLTAVSLFRHDENRVIAYDLETGELLWQAAPDNPIHHGLSVDGARVLGTDQEGVAYGWDAATGEHIWRRDLGRSSFISHVAGGVAGGGVYYTGFGNYLSALDAANGNVLWRSTAWNGGYVPPAPHALAGDTLVVGAQWSGIHGHNTASGARRWSITSNQTNNGVADGIRNRSQGAVWFDNELYVMGSNALVRLNATTGARLRTDNLPYNKDVASRPFVDATRVITGTAADGLAAFDRATGTALWRVETEPALVFTSPYTRPNARTAHSEPVRAGEHLIFGASDGHLYVVELASGALVHRFHLGAPVFGAVVGAPDGSILVADYGGSLYKFSREIETTTKADNVLNLDQGDSWIGGEAPDAEAVAVFDGIFSGSAPLDTGSPMEVAGLRVTDGPAPVVIDNTATLTVGAFGIDLREATRDMHVAQLAANASQSWSVAPGRRLVLGAVSGSAGVSLGGGGLVVMEGTDARSGSTSVLADTTLEIGAAGSVAGAISNQGTVIFNRSGDFTYNGAIGGTGMLVKEGAGRLTFPAVQPFTGDTVVNAGTLALTGGSPGSGQHRLNSGTLYINEGATFSFNGTAQFGWAAGTPRVVMDGGRITTTNGTYQYLKDVTMRNGSRIEFGTTTSSGFTAVQNYSMTSLVSEASDTANVITGGAIAVANPMTVAVGRGAAADDLVIESLLRNHPTTNADGSLVKNGPGILRLGAANSYSGDTRVLDGTLTLAHATLADAAGVHIADGATLHLPHGQADTVGGLWLGGVRMPAGTYHAGNTTAITGGGSLVVAAGPPPGTYDAWITGHFPGETNPAVLGPHADANGDGVANALVYLFGGDPKEGSNQTLLPTAMRVTDPGPPAPAGEYFVITYRHDSGASVVSFVESSNSLDGAWTPAVDGVDGVIVTTTPDGFAVGIDRVVVRIPGGVPRMFVRLGVIPQ